MNVNALHVRVFYTACACTSDPVFLCSCVPASSFPVFQPPVFKLQVSKVSQGQDGVSFDQPEAVVPFLWRETESEAILQQI